MYHTTRRWIAGVALLLCAALANAQSADDGLPRSGYSADGRKFSIAVIPNGNSSQGGAYLRTADNAPLNAETFKNGYTFEAFARFPEDCCGPDPWMGLLARQGTQGDLGIKTAGDPNNPAVTWSVSPSVEFQWAIQPFTQPDLVTNWSFRAPTLTWYHVALVNDGKTTKLFINGSEDVRNSQDLSVGLQSTGEFWMIGATQYGRVVGPAFYGWLGDVRIVNRPLTAREFMISR